MRKLFLLICAVVCAMHGISGAESNPLPNDIAQYDNHQPPILVMHLFESSGEIQSSKLQANRSYDIFIKGYPNEEHLLVLDYSNLGANELAIFGEKVNSRSTCFAYHLKSTESLCRETWIKQFKSCPLQTMNLPDVRMTLKTREPRDSSLITYKTVNCASGEVTTQKTTAARCEPKPKTESNDLSSLEVILLIALCFTSCMAILFGALLLRIQCNTPRQKERKSTIPANSFKRKDLSQYKDGPAVLVDNVLYASVGGEATKM